MIKLPKTENKKADQTGFFNKPTPIGMDPRSSVIGTIERIKVINSLGKFFRYSIRNIFL